MRVILIRHGSTPANEQWLYCGQTDVSLSEKGAEELREKRRAGGYPDADGCRVYTSGLKRTEETLELLFGALPHESEPGLREISFGDYEMKSYFDLEKVPGFLEWLDKSEETAPPGGESGREMRERVNEAFFRLLEKGEDMLLVLHGGPIASLMQTLFPAEEKGRYDWQPKGGEGYELLFADGRAISWRRVPVYESEEA